MSDSVRPHRWQSTWLLRPWDSPNKNTGVGCHFLLQCMEVKSESEVTQSCLTLSDPMDCSLPGSSVHGIFQARVPEWGAIAFSDMFLQLEPPSHPTSLHCHTALALGSPSHTANSHWLPILHMLMYMFQCYFLKSSHPFPPLL